MAEDFAMQLAGQQHSDSRTGLHLGVDPGLNRTGYAVMQRQGRSIKLHEGGVIRSTPSLSLSERVREIGEGLREVLEQFNPCAMAVEQVFSFKGNPKTALLMAHARGAILMVAAERQIPVVHYTPTQVKRLLTGSGRASKEQIQAAVQRELGLKSILEPNDVADAVAVAICLCHGVRLTEIGAR
jgi:crossover junction endodeoxyribonuclease RuvC